MSSTTASRSLGCVVRVEGAPVGHVTGIVLDGPHGEPIGLEVTSFTGAQHFLPWVAGIPREGVVELASPFLLVDAYAAYIARGAVVVRDVGDVSPSAAAGKSTA